MLGKIVLDTLMEPKLILKSLPAPIELYEKYGIDSNGISYGNYSISSPRRMFQCREGYLTKRACVFRHLVTLPGTEITDTQTAFTRCWLKGFPQRRTRKLQYEAFRQARPPMYCKPANSNTEVFYVDIASAYHSIYSRLSWKVEYLRGQYFSNDDDKLVFPFPLEWKTARSYVITAALPANKRLLFNGKVVETPSHNPHFNSPLVCAVWDVLGAIGRFAVDVYGAHYYNVDGAIIAGSRFFDYCDFLDSLGLTYRTKHSGFARIQNLGSWKIGEHQTLRFDRNSVVTSVDAIPMTIADAEWVLTRFVRL
jgi:hypothetical protein